MSLAEPKSSVIANGIKCITSKFTDGSEMVEEYDVITDELISRKRRTRTTLGAVSEWIVEVGKVEKSRNLDKELLVETIGSPELVRQDSAECHIFRIRNLPYEKSVYNITIERKSDDDKIGEIVVRTTNKKYFKRLAIPEMERAHLPLEQNNIKYDVKHNTLIIEYKKHPNIKIAEAAARKERSSIPSERLSEKDSACAQQ